MDLCTVLIHSKHIAIPPMRWEKDAFDDGIHVADLLIPTCVHLNLVIGRCSKSSDIPVLTRDRQPPCVPPRLAVYNRAWGLGLRHTWLDDLCFFFSRVWLWGKRDYVRRLSRPKRFDESFKGFLFQQG